MRSAQFITDPGVVFAIGIFFVAVGTLATVFRKPVHRWVVEQRRSSLGDDHARHYKMTHHVICAVILAGLGGTLAIAAVAELLS